jgi:hypothetical protein
VRRHDQKRLKWQSGTRRTRTKLVLTSTYLTPAQARALAALVERTKVPATAYLRAGLDLILAKPELVQGARP